MPMKNNVITGRLADEDAELFYKLWMGLLNFVNQKHKVKPGLGKLSSPKNVNIQMLMPVRDKLWEDVSIIDEYIETATLSGDEAFILAGWKDAVCGDFILIKHLKKYSVLMTPESTPLLYGVTGIYSTLGEMVPKERLPVSINCALIPFRGRVIYDSMLRGGNVTYGSGYRKGFNDACRTSKEQYGIIESFDKAPEIRARHAADSIRRSRIREDILVDTYDEYEEASAWHCYLTDNLRFPFEAVCEKQIICSPLRSGENVTVTGIADIKDYHGGIAVIVKWQDRKFAVPLEQLKPVDSSAEFAEAIEDWKYWMVAGC